MNRAELRDFAVNAQRMIEEGAVEGRIRHYLSSRLPSIFPDAPWWVQAHMQGTEEHVQFATASGNRGGFVDAVVGKTAIEYEKNLTIPGIFNEGYHQVKEYTAALCNMGIPEEEVLGVLSDTVRWYGYKIHIVGDVFDGEMLGPDDVELEEVTSVDLSVNTDIEFSRFERFINQFMARERSRILNASTLSMDFGVESSFYRDSIGMFSEAVHRAMEEKPDYAKLIKQVWQNFVAYLGASDFGSFSIETYINEFYLVTVAKILCVNILAGRTIISSDDEMKAILDGEYFKGQNISNFIDYDYFGWLNDSPYVDRIIPRVREVQNRLQAYDFSRIGEQDIFGRLLAQLANREHRLMLGQEFTPHWIARDIVEYNIAKIGDEEPRIMDMCCGSGVFLIESIKAVREKYSISADPDYNERKDNIIFSAVMGFDIDPLAVMLAKVNWIMAMRDLFPVHAGSITVPIYHADSLFVETQITRRISTPDEDYYAFTLDDQQLRIPEFLFSAAYRRVFDSFLSKVYQLAMARAAKPEAANGAIPTDSLVEAVVCESGTELETDKKTELGEIAVRMITMLERLQRQGRNGIWQFIISNSYRPGLTEKQFNCIVSNPPWMAMSKLADNPYKEALRGIAQKYALQPPGAARPHMELATIFLVSSVDRYLKHGAHWSYIMPASLMSGHNHEPFRKEEYRVSAAMLKTRVAAIWELPTDTFKNKAVVLSGEKSDVTPDTIEGRVYDTAEEYENCIYTLKHLGNISAWSNRGGDIMAEESIDFREGCDLFPRTVLFHQYTHKPNGNWDIAPINRTGELWYLWNDSKTDVGRNLRADNFANEFMYDAFISKHLSPFIMAEPSKTLIPGRKVQGIWTPVSPDDLALMNEGTKYVFQQVTEAAQRALRRDLVSYLEYINRFGKLDHQDFSEGGFLVLSNAGGSNPCASYIDLRDYNRDRLIIDQTLYWYLAGTEDEAIYYTGLINSGALRTIISDFQPEGSFGERHIHKLPYRVMPTFDPENDAHREIVEATRVLMEEWKNVCADGKYKNLLEPNSGALASRRKRQQGMIRTLSAYERYDAACACIL